MFQADEKKDGIIKMLEYAGEVRRIRLFLVTTTMICVCLMRNFIVWPWGMPAMH